MKTRIASLTNSFDENSVSVFKSSFKVLFGVIFLAAMAQLRVQIPGWIVPFTGQTLGVMAIAAWLTPKEAVAATMSYLLVGALGLPVFTGFGSGITLGPTLGYLIGMPISAYMMSVYLHRKPKHSFAEITLVGVLGSLVTISFGVVTVTYFTGFKMAILAGVLPFLPIEIAKAAMVASFRKK